MNIYTPTPITQQIRDNFRPTRLYIKELAGVYYFGKSVVSDIESYTGSGKVWKDRIKKYGKKNIKTVWFSDWYESPDDIQPVALHFSQENQIVESTMWANLKPENGIDGGTSEAAVESYKKTVSDPEWQATVGSVARRKLSQTLNDPIWVEKVGKQGRKKQSATRKSAEWKNENQDMIEASRLKRLETITSEEWRETKGVEKSKKASESLSKTMGDPNWRDTVGKERTEKQVATKLSEEWKTTVGVERNRKCSESVKKTLSSQEWIDQNYKTCEFCGKFVAPWHYSHHHGHNCSLNPDGPKFKTKKPSLSLVGKRKRKLPEGEWTWEYPDGNGGYVLFDEFKALQENIK